MCTYITGDKHGDFTSIYDLCTRIETSKDDLMILLGDSSINYYQDGRDKKLKESLSKLPLTFLCIKGNHEKDVRNISSYKEVAFNGGIAYVQKKFPNIYFAKDGEIYDLETSNGVKKFIAIGGAYSVDKHHRLARGFHWFEDEQLSEEQKQYVEFQLDKNNWAIDYVLSHTAPVSYEPIEWFLSSIDSSTVDKSTEDWLDTIYTRLTLNEKWYCGHYHGDKVIDNLVFMFNDIKLI